MILTDIKKGDVVIVTRIKSCEIKDKLMEMGCIPGTIVSLRLRAPLGDPLAYDVDGYCLSMRRSEAKQIEVEYITTNEE